MNLSLKELQILDFLLQLNYSNKVCIVIEIKDKFWYGNFINCPGKVIYNYSIGDSNTINDSKITIKDLFGEKPYYPKISNIDKKHLPLVLEHLVSFIKSSDLPDINLKSILYNATNVEDNIQLPFLYLNSSDTYNVVSLMIFTKE